MADCDVIRHTVHPSPVAPSCQWTAGAVSPGAIGSNVPCVHIYASEPTTAVVIVAALSGSGCKGNNITTKEGMYELSICK